MVISGKSARAATATSPSRTMTAERAEAITLADRHLPDTEADMVSAFTMNYVEEAVGIARAAKAAGMPCVISFTLETDGRLPTGETLKEAIEAVDAATGEAPGLLHDQLRASDPLRQMPRGRRALGEAHPRPPRQLLAAKPRRARPARNSTPATRSSSAGSIASLRQASAYQRARRLLRHRPPPRGGDRRSCAQPPPPPAQRPTIRASDQSAHLLAGSVTKRHRRARARTV